MSEQNIIDIGSSEKLLQKFSDLIAPLAKDTVGLGDSVEQKFKNKTNAEKVIESYAVEKAVTKAKRRNVKLEISNAKSFIKALEEVTTELNPTLHEMWVNLLASELVPGESHPHLVETLPHLTTKETQILESLNSQEEIGLSSGIAILESDGFKGWINSAQDKDIKQWDYSCVLLCQLGLAGTIGFDNEFQENPLETPILYKTVWGNKLLKVVSDC